MYPPADVIHDLQENDTVTLEELNEKLFHLHIPAVVFVALGMVVGVVGNVLVFFVYKAKFRRSNHRYFILFLASLDFLACTTGMPFLIASLRLPYLMPYRDLCKSVRYIHYLVNNASGLLLLVISVERFRKICHPLKKQISHRQTLYLCYGTIAFSAIMAVPAAIFYGSSEINTGQTNLTGYQCYVDDSQKNSVWFELYQGLLLIETFLCIVIFIVLYVFIVRRLWTSDQFLQAMRNMQYTSSKQSQEVTSFSTDMDQEESSESKLSRSQIENCISPLVNKDQCKKQPSENSQNANNQSQSLDYIDHKTNNGLNGTKWPAAKELFKRKDIRSIKPTLERSSSDTRLNKTSCVLPSDKCRTLTPTERLVVGTLFKSSSANLPKPKRTKQSRTTARITIMLFIVSVVFAFSFIPHLTLMIITVQDESFLSSLTATDLIVYQVFLRSFIVNNVVNPIIYLIFDSKFRQICKEFCCTLKKNR